ncbi:uncharacterized protein LOC123702612 isoform X1 [Colias croceus]|uniref:uncharacterized protein LOC123702612 isoform X1 n=1 Tax=Colias crocea TaxID=72248 RepID=UPI001E27DCF2|nr:uncharacterized protein LOC123702612 isoform X1 [Colias croceus]
MFKVSLVFLALVGVCFAAEALMKPDPKPPKLKDVEGCYIKNLDQVIPPGGSLPSTESCMMYTCGREYVTLTSCGVAAAEPPCKVVHYNDFVARPYPKCCPTVECP